MAQKTTFFEFSSFNNYRKANLEPITHEKIHDKYKEIRDIMGLIKDYHSNPEQISTFHEKLKTLSNETPPQTPDRKEKKSVRTPEKTPQKDHETRSSHKKSKGSKQNSIQKESEDPLKYMIQALQSHLAQNLEETKELKQIFLQSQIKGQAAPSIKTSFLDVLHESPDLRKFSESSFGKSGAYETVETMSPGITKGVEGKDNVGFDISQAERRVYELQTQRFLNKIQELNKKNEGLDKKLKNLNENVSKYKEFISQPRIIGKFGISARHFIKDNMKNLTKDQVLLEEYETIYFDIDNEFIKIYKDSDFSNLFRTITWTTVIELSLFEKGQEPFIGFFVMKIKEKEGDEPEYRLLKVLDGKDSFWETVFLGYVLKIQIKTNDFYRYLRRSHLQKTLILNENTIKISESAISSLGGGLKEGIIPKSAPHRGVDSLKPRKSIKNSSFHQMANSSNQNQRRSHNLLTSSSKSLQPQRHENSFHAMGDANKYLSTYDLISANQQPFELNESMIKRGLADSQNNLLKAMNILKNGFVFLKYGKYGDPHERLLMLSACEKKIEWRQINKKTANFIELETVKDIKEGRNSQIFSKFKVKTTEQALLSFSIYYTNNKTLDLEANNMENKQKFIRSLGIVVQNAKKEAKKKGVVNRANTKRIITEEAFQKQRSLKSSKNFSVMDVDDGSDKD